jgi:Peptidase of plants and bacteria
VLGLSCLVTNLGIADFIRLRAGLAPKHWKPTRTGSWDAGYETTAYFLDFVDKQIYPGFVACVNEWLGQECAADRSYDETRMFSEVMPGWGWDTLWSQYVESQ